MLGVLLLFGLEYALLKELRKCTGKVSSFFQVSSPEGGLITLIGFRPPKEYSKSLELRHYCKLVNLGKEFFGEFSGVLCGSSSTLKS